MKTLPQPMADRLERLVSNPSIGDTTATAADARAEASQLFELERLQQSAAYWDPNHIEHERVKAKVRLMHEIEFEGQGHSRRPSPVVIDTSKTQIAEPVVRSARDKPLNGGIWGPQGAPKRGGG